jgi:hypothetical protein
MKWGNGAKSILIAQVGIARPRKLDLAVQSLATWNWERTPHRRRLIVHRGQGAPRRPPTTELGVGFGRNLILAVLEGIGASLALLHEARADNNAE